MSLIQNIQNKPQAVKLKIMWAVGIGTAIFLILVWIVSAKFHKNIPKDTKLFDTIGKGIKDAKDNYGKPINNN